MRIIPRLLTIRYLPVFCALLLCMTNLQAQRSSWSIAASVGASFPAGKFAGNNFSDSSESLARMGLALDFLLQYRLSSRFGLALLGTGQQNLVDINRIENELNPPNTDTSISGTRVSSGAWNIGKILIGPTLSLPFGRKKKWCFTSRLMLGVLRTAEPELTITQETLYSIPGGGLSSGGFNSFTSGESYQGKISLPWTLAYLGSAGILYPINARWNFRADIDYSTAMVKIPYNYIRHSFQQPLSLMTSSGGTTVVIPGPPHNTSYSLPISSVNLSVGLEMRL